MAARRVSVISPSAAMSAAAAESDAAKDHVASTTGNALRETAVRAAAGETTGDVEFSIDELRAIAHCVGVRQRAQITERSELVREIRRRL